MMSLKDITLEEAQHICQNHPRCAGCPFYDPDDCILEGMPKYWAGMEGDEDDMDDEDSGTPSCESLHHVEEPELTAGSLVSPYPFKDTVEPEADQTIKADAGKLPLTLVPREAIRAIAKIRQYGVAKYGSAENWRQVAPERYRDAAFRHFLAYLDDPQGTDEESGLPHLWHCLCNLAFLCELEKEGQA